MYGSIFRMWPKQGREDELIGLMDEWERDMRPHVPGVVASYVVRPDNAPDQLVGVAVFEDRESYRANAESPEQDAWYRRMRDCLESDPEWQDGEFIGAWH